MMAAPAALSSGFVHACGWHGRSAARRRRKRRWQGQGAGGTARQLQLEQPISSRCRIRDRKDQHNRRELACKGASWLGVLLAEKHGTARTTPPTRAAPVSCGAPLFLGLLSFVATRCQPVHPLLDLPRWHLQRSRGRPPPAPCAAAAMRAPTPLPLCTPRCCCEQAGSAVPGAGLGPHPAQLCHAGRGGPRPGRAAGQPRRRRGRQPAARPPPAVPHGRHQGKPGWVGACVCVLGLSLFLSFPTQGASAGWLVRWRVHERWQPADAAAAPARLQMWTKLRPGVREFLARASQYFQLWIHTNGGQQRGRGRDTRSRNAAAAGNLAAADRQSWCHTAQSAREHPRPPCPCPSHAARPPQATACMLPACAGCWTPLAPTLGTASSHRWGGVRGPAAEVCGDKWAGPQAMVLWVLWPAGQLGSHSLDHPPTRRAPTAWTKWCQTKLSASCRRALRQGPASGPSSRCRLSSHRPPLLQGLWSGREIARLTSLPACLPPLLPRCTPS